MAKKIPSIKKEIEALNKEKSALEAKQQVLENEILALEEEKKHDYDQTKSLIIETCREKYFCGVILTPDDISAIVQMALKTRDNIQIEFNLYPIAETEETPVIPISETPEENTEP